MEYITRTARKTDTESLKRLWNECFPDDTDSFRDFFFERIYDADSTLVCTADGEIASMLHMLPYEFSTPAGVLSAKYIYGVATGKDYRNRGLAGNLLLSAEDSCDFTVLIPQDEQLFALYEKFGYSESIYCGNGRKDSNGRRAVYADIPMLNSVYEKSLCGFIHPVRSEKDWKIIIEEYKICLCDDGYFCNEESFPTHDASARRIGLAKTITSSAKKIFSECGRRYMNLMHN
mgnify:FL=1